MNSEVARTSWRTRLTGHIPPGQLARYLLVGAWNTVFAYGTFAALTAALESVVPQSYILASVLSSVINITVSFLGYKWFVFKTKGNYLREWVRCAGVYSGSILLGVLSLPVMVLTIRHNFGYGREAPYIAGALLTGVTVIMSFCGHKWFSFRSPRSGDSGGTQR
jgi:putative flippase GtrA